MIRLLFFRNWLFVSLFAVVFSNAKEINNDYLHTYKLRELDLVTVNVYNQPDLKTEQRIDSNGEISLPLIGKTSIMGITLREAESKIRNQYIDKRFLKNPQVTMSITEYSKKTISVIGQVNKPGVFDYELETDQMDIIDVIALAGDFTGVAKKNSVMVIRQTLEGEKRFTVNVIDQMLGKKEKKNIDRFYVYPGDVVLVQESLF